MSRVAFILLVSYPTLAEAVDLLTLTLATDIPETSVPAAPTPAPLPVEWPLVRDGPRFKVNGTKYQQVKPSVAALRYGGFVVAYQSLQDVFACRFDASGKQVGSEIQLNVYTSGDQESVRVSGLATGGFVATWVSRYQAGGLQDVVGRTFLSTGANSSSEFIVTKASQKDHHVIGLSGGNFVVTWTETSGGLRSNIYNPKGQPMHELPFTVDQRAKQNQGLVALQSGGFMCVYTSATTSQSLDALEATAYDSNLVGTAHTQIMSLPISTAYEFAVSSGPDGVVVVSAGAEMSTMQGSLFDTTGNMKAKFNYTVGGDMLKYWQPSLSSFPSGGFLLTWRAGKAANESGIYYTWHVYGQVFGNDGGAVGQPSFLNYASAATGSFVTATSRVNGCGESEMCNRVAVVYDSDRLGGIHVYGQLYNSLLLPTAAPSTPAPPTRAPPTDAPATDIPETSVPAAPTPTPIPPAPLTPLPPVSPPTWVPDTYVPAATHWPATEAPSSPYTDAPSQSPSAHWPNTSSPSSHWPYTDAPTHSPSAHWPYTDAPSSHWPYTDAPTHSPSSHWPYTDAPSSHWPYTDAPTHSPSSHWPYTDAPSSHWPYTDAPTHSPSAHWPYTDAPSSHWPYTDAPTHSPSAHWPYTDAPSSHWPYTDAPTHSPSSHWPYTDAPTNSPSAHWPYTDAPSSHWPYTPSPGQSSYAPGVPSPPTRPPHPHVSPVPSSSGPPHSAPAAPTTASGTVVLEDFVIVILVLLGLCLFAGGIFIGVNRGRTRQPVPVLGDEISSRLYEPPHVQMTEEELADVPEIAE